MATRFKAKNSLRKLLFIVVLAWAGWQYSQPQRAIQPPQTQSSASDNQALLQAIEQQRSNVWVIAEGRVKRILSDDNNGSRHQRFILLLGPGLTVLIAHNIDLAPRVPLQNGDNIRLRGEYEWNPKGGVIHWTHHDPGGRKKGGWIEYQNQLYQ